jgi:acyl-coenzyme A thioesterase PaaI-like protein
MTDQLADGNDALESWADDPRSDFPEPTATDASPSFGPFVAAMRTLQDLAVSVDAPEEVLADAVERADAMIGLLEPHRAAEGEPPAGRVWELPGRGSLLLPPFAVDKFDAEGVRARGVLRRYHLGGNSAAHGGVLPLIFDDNFGMVVYAARRPISRTGYLHIDYRHVTPLDTPLIVSGSVTRVEGRKTYVKSTLTLDDGTLLAESEGLMIALLPGQP